MKPIIRVDNLGKQYRLGCRGASYGTLRESLTRIGRAPFDCLRRGSKKVGAQVNGEPQPDRFWALKHVCFEVVPGEVVGIIGRNGAGKSTLLKILTRITEPTTGTVDLFGRVGSLLEVGTGFHPELTGRENIFLSGTILGMRRWEIQRQFDQIVEFAGIERFLETPVKRYSSGMYLRLGFSVAAHLNPEILVVDEVLAVGDAQFQKKCLGKIEDVARDGRTVLFVSHNMPAVQSICSRGILLDNGRLKSNDAIGVCVRNYLGGGGEALRSCWRRADKGQSKLLEFEELSLELYDQQPNMRLRIQTTLSTCPPHKPAFVAFDITNASGNPIMQALPTIEPFITDCWHVHNLCVNIELPSLVPGPYMISAWVGPHNTLTYDYVPNCAGFHIDESPTIGRTFPHTSDHGYIVPTCKYAYAPG